MKLPSTTECQLLSVLGSRELNGRELADAFKKEYGRSISYGTLYTAMRRLKEGKWVEMREAQDIDGRLRYFRVVGSSHTRLAHLLAAFHGAPNYAMEGVP